MNEFLVQGKITPEFKHGPQVAAIAIPIENLELIHVIHSFEMSTVISRRYVLKHVHLTRGHSLEGDGRSATSTFRASSEDMLLATVICWLTLQKLLIGQWRWC